MSKDFTTDSMVDIDEGIDHNITADENIVEKNNEHKKTYDPDQIDSVLDVVNNASPISKDVPSESVNKSNDNENRESRDIRLNECTSCEPSEGERKISKKYRTTKRNALCLVVALTAISMFACIFSCCTVIAAVGLTVNEITCYTAMSSVIISLFHMWCGGYIIKSMHM